MSSPFDFPGIGVYPLHRAAQLARADARAVGRWLKGVSRQTEAGLVRSEPLWRLQFADDEHFGRLHVLGFKDLLELRIVAGLVRQGVPLRTLRATLKTAREVLGEHPLHRPDFLREGLRIFLDAAERAGDKPCRVDTERRRAMFDAVMQASLFDGVEYDSEGAALRWYPVGGERLIVLDPQRQFGEAIVQNRAVPTDTLYAAYRANDRDFDFVSRIYEVDEPSVRAAVAFEAGLPP